MSGGGSVSETREGISASETIGRLARARRWLWHLRVIIPVAVVALVLVSVGVRYLLGDGMSGPHGSFPGPVAAQAPARTPQRVATSLEGPGGIQIYGGVAINGVSLGGPDDAVRAVSIATGKTYWEYDKQKHAEPIGLDRTTGDVYVDGEHDLAKINVHTGRIRWSRPTPGHFPNEHAIVSDTGTRTLVIFNDGGDGTMTGIDPVTGRTRWTSALGCDVRMGSTVVVGGTLAMTCGLADDLVHGIDLATGKQRWYEDFARLFPEKPHGDNRDDFFVLDAGQGRVAVTTRDGFDLLDATTGKILRHRVTNGEVPVAFSDGMWLSTCALDKTEGVCASDTDTGKRLWSSPFPGHQAGYSPGDPGRLAYATVANGRVYSLSHSLSATDPRQKEIDQIVVFDLRTGRRLTYWSYDGLMRLRDSFTIADGVVVVHDGGLGSGSVALYADRPDLHGTRHL